MCGIAGILRFGDEHGMWPAAARQAEVERMTRAIAHRGPDGHGFFVRDNVALGHRRLSIIDLEAGRQPMSNEDGTVWVTFNGEIYNYRELTEELKAAGHVFKSHCDTEVIVHGYEQWGDACVEKFRGMFAFAVFDLKSRKGLLARDHFGIKPLYYRRGPGYLAFASELAALRAVEAPPPAGNLEAVELFLRYQYIPTPHTVYRDTFKLPPAHRISLSLDGDVAPPDRYWDFRFNPVRGVSEGEWEERFEAVLADSVKAHLVADVPFGVFLSGGIDSTLVALEMSRILERPVEGFSIGFKEEQYSELPHAAAVAEKIGFPLHTHVVEGDSLEMLPALVAHYGEPFGDSSAVPTWHVSKLAREHVPMVLSGDGGDEAFGGYTSYVNWMQSTPRRLAGRTARASRTSGKLLLRLLAHRVRHGSWLRPDVWERSLHYLSGPTRQALWRREFQGLTRRPCGLFAESSRRAPKADWLAYAQYMDFQTYLPCDILTKVDVASMYHGLEVRTPLIDLRVLELAASLPLSQRMPAAAGPAGFTPKHLPKKVVQKVFPPEFVHRTKMGFAMPRALWFLPGHSGRRILEDVLLDPRSRLNQWFEPHRLRYELEAHQPGRDNSNVLWLLLVLGVWLGQNPEVSFG